MNREHLQKKGTENKIEGKLEEIRIFLSSLHCEVDSLEKSYSQVLSVLEALESRLEDTADRDDLTGLLRRKAFFHKWKALLKRCTEIGQACSVLMLDIDHFKKINDTYGHSCGDEVIRRVSGLLQKFASPDCIVGRYGGEEFIVAFADSGENAAALGEEIRRTIANTPAEVPCTISIGVSSSENADKVEPDLLIRNADRALYTAKQKGRNQVAKG